MSEFNKAVEKLLVHEGGFVNNPLDTGGATNWGISSRFLKNETGRVYSVDEIRRLTKEDAKKLYKKYFWDKLSADKIKYYSVAFTLFDQAVNRGPHVVINEVRNILGQASIPMTETQAYMPADTLKILNTIEEKLFLTKFLEKAKAYYYRIVERNPTQDRFLNGWLYRVNSIADYTGVNLGIINAKNTSIVLGISVLAVAGFYLFRQMNKKQLKTA